MTRRFLGKIAYSFYSPLMWVILLIKGVKVKKNSFFYGLALFSRHKNSSISIGDRCIFNNKSTSNLIGVNHKCIISTLSPEAKIKIGDNCGFSGTTIGSEISITLGNRVRCGANTLITDTDWHSDDPRTSSALPIIINDNVWLGYGAIVLKGVTIGENTIIGAGSVVTKNIPANVVAAGNPCKVIKLLDGDMLNKIHA